jgi:hypothetical protein
MISRRAALAAVACASLLSLGAAPSAWSAPDADSQGYVDSTARCTAPDTAVVFGSTDSSRVAICATSDGLEYRGVRVRDGARLIAAATRSADGAFTATKDGIDYMVTSDALVISAGERVIRDESMLDFHRPGAPAAASQTPTSTKPLPPPLAAEVGGTKG